MQQRLTGLRVTNWHCQHRVEDVHHQRIMGHHHFGADRKFSFPQPPFSPTPPISSPSIFLAFAHDSTNRRSTGSRQKARPWRKSTRFLRARNTPTCRMWIRCARGVRRWTSGPWRRSCSVVGMGVGASVSVRVGAGPVVARRLRLRG